MTESTPSLARWIAALRPMPRLPPVIRAMRWSGTGTSLGSDWVSPCCARAAGATRGRFSQGPAVPGYGEADVPYSIYGPRRPRRLSPPPPRSAATRRRRARPGAPPPHRRAAPRGGRPAGPHVDRLLRADRAAARLAALGSDGG